MPFSRYFVINTCLFRLFPSVLQEKSMTDKRLERDYARLCSMILAGTAPDDEVPVALDNLFYERFGMGVHEIVAALGQQLQQKLPLPIDIAAEFD